MRWPLIPAWAAGIPVKFATHNVKQRTWRRRDLEPVWAKGQRCIVTTGGFYEWQWSGVDGASTQPFFIKTADQAVFGFAALWEITTPAGGAPLYTCTIVTTRANELMQSIHNSKKVGSSAYDCSKKIGASVILSKVDRETWLTGNHRGGASGHQSVSVRPDVGLSRLAASGEHPE